MAPQLTAFGREHGGSLLQPHQLLVAYDDALALGITHLQAVRLRFLDAEQRPGSAASKGLVRLVCVVDRPLGASSAALAPSRVLVHPWVLEHLQLFDGCAVDVERVEQQQSAPATESHAVLVSVRDRYPASVGANAAPPPSIAANASKEEEHRTDNDAIVSHAGLLPESVRTGKLSLASAILRQLRAMFGRELSARELAPRQLLPVRILKELYVLRVESVRPRQQGIEDAAAPPIVVEVAGLDTLSNDLGDQASSLDSQRLRLGATDKAKEAVGFNAQLDSRLAREGFVGYNDVVRDVLLHFALAIDAGGPADAAVDYQDIGSHGLILSGVHGAGKSLALKVIEKELAREGVTTWRVDAMSLLMDFENSKKPNAYDYLSDKTDQMIATSYSADPSPPSRVVVLIDDLEALFMSTDGQVVDEDTQAHHLPPLGSSLLRLLDDISARRSRVVVLGASSNPEVDIPAPARRVGRFGREIELIVPTEATRRDILRVHLGQLRLDGGDDDDDGSGEVSADFAARMATLTGGYVAKDLVRICRNASVAAFARASTGSESDPNGGAVTWADLVAAQQGIKPSQLRELNVSAPGAAGRTQFVGYRDVRKQLFEFVSWKFHPTVAVQRLGVGNTSGVLLFGPSGCGKSLLVKELTAQAKVNCVSVKSSELVSKYFGDSEKAIRQLFARARKAAPCLLFFDEFDAIAHKRSFDKGDGDDSSGGGVYARILSTFLNELDGVGSAGKTAMDGILVVAATNRKDTLDAALIRPGRIDKTLELGYPTQEDIQDILTHYTSKMPLAHDVDLADLATTAQASGRNVSGADLSAVCKEAAFRALREDLDTQEVCMRHFEAAWVHRLEESLV